MSPSLLSSRLKSLESSGVIERNKTDKGVIYSLTQAGEEIGPIIEQLGVWGQRWARSDLSKKDLDPSLLMWDAHRRIDTSHFPDERTVLRFEFVDYPSKLRLWSATPSRWGRRCAGGLSRCATARRRSSPCSCRRLWRRWRPRGRGSRTIARLLLRRRAAAASTIPPVPLPRQEGGA